MHASKRFYALALHYRFSRITFRAMKMHGGVYPHDKAADQTT